MFSLYRQINVFAEDDFVGRILAKTFAYLFSDPILSNVIYRREGGSLRKTNNPHYAHAMETLQP